MSSNSRSLISRNNQPNRLPIQKYQAFPPIDIDRTWPSATMTSAPLWCSVDLRDGNDRQEPQEQQHQREEQADAPQERQDPSRRILGDHEGRGRCCPDDEGHCRV